MDFSWCSYIVKWFSPLESFSWRWAGRLWFLAIFPSLFSRLLTFPFILACVHCPSSTCRVNLSKTDTCPISPYPKSLGVVVKAEECGSVRCRVLNGSKGSFPWIFWIFFQAGPMPLLPLFPVGLWVYRGLNCPRLYPQAILCFIFLSLGHSPPRLGPLDSLRVCESGP